MSTNQKFEQNRVNTLPTTGLVAGNTYALNVGGGKYKNFIVSNNLDLISEAGAEFIEKDTMAQFRAITAREIWAIQNGYYKGVKLNGYYIKGDTPAPIEYYISATSQTDNGGSVIEVGGVKFEYVFTQVIDITYFGAKGDSTFDNLNIIQNVFDYADGKGLEVIIPKQNGDFLVSNAITVGSKTTVTWLGSFIKAKNYTTIGTILFNKSNSSGIVLNNPLIDADNIIAGGTGENGISMQNVKNVRIYGGVIKNCKKGTEAFKLGGKGFQFEAINVEDVIVDGARVENCSWAMSSQFNIQGNIDAGDTKVEVSFNNIYAMNCTNLAILHQSNGLVDSDKHIVSLNNITSFNCGDPDGLIIVSRLKNAKLNNITCIGNVQIGSFIRGRHANCSFRDIKILQPMSSLIWNQPSFHGEATRLSENNNYQFKVDAQITNILNSSTDSTYANRELRSSTINVESSREDFNFSVSQAAWPTTNVNVITPNKNILINTTEAVLQSKNTPTSFNQLFSLGSARKLKIGTTNPNSNTVGDTGDMYLQETASYANIFFKYFGAGTNTGWANLMPALSGTTTTRPGSIAHPAGGVYWNTTTSKAEINTGSAWVEIAPVATTGIKGIVNQTAALANISQADLVNTTAADVAALVSYINTNVVPLVNAIKSSQNTELTNQRTAGQQAP